MVSQKLAVKFAFLHRNLVFGRVAWGKGLCLSFVLSLAFGLGEGELGVVIVRLSAVRMD